MEIYQGTSVSDGIAIGKIHVYKKEAQQAERKSVEDSDAEIARYMKAKETASLQLQQLYEKALKEVGEAKAAIFEVHQMMLEDGGYQESVKTIIGTQKVNAEYAVAVTGDKYCRMFAAMEDAYMRERSADIKDISQRLIQALNPGHREGFLALEPVILVAEDLAPSETLQMDKDMVLSFVTALGSVNSHTAILARTMGIPALVNAAAGIQEENGKKEYGGLLSDALEGKLGAVDGSTGILYVEPEPELLKELEEKKQEERERKELLFALKGRESVTLDGQKIHLYANIGNSKDLELALQNDAEGIGLFRSEFIYLEKENYPTEEEQFSIYKTVAETMAGKQVVIRTLDIGADKKCGYFHMEPEENPALGYRAIRICLSEPQVFKTQLRALFRAAVFGKLAVMYPMVTSVWEVKKIKELAAEVCRELQEQGMDYLLPKQGIMIETPAAVMMSRELAREVDFFSIGTNDLTQYTLAVDRQNPRLEAFYDPHHPAVLRMIEMVVDNAHKEGIWAGICGELGADMDLTQKFLAMGVDELSVSPGSILPIRQIVCKTDVKECQGGNCYGK